MLDFFYSIGITRLTFLALALLISVIFKITYLNDRPFHHDESIHAQLSYNYYLNPNRDYYKYDPVYHGPTLYILLRYWYIFSDYYLDSTPRLLIFFISLLTPLLVLGLKNFLGNDQTYWILLCILLSPTLNFFSSWVREDTIVLVSFLISFYGLLTLNPYFFFIGAGVHLATKASFFIHYPLIFVFFIYYLFFNRKSALQFLNKFKLNYRKVLLSLVLGFFVFLYLITTEFRNFEATYEVFTKNLAHWFEMHQKERIGGPFGYMLTLIAFYEQPLFILTCATILHFVISNLNNFFSSYSQRFTLFIITISLLIFSLLTICRVPFGLTPFDMLNQTPILGSIIKFLKLKGNADLFICLLIFLSGFFITTKYIKNQFEVSFLSFIFFSFLFVYSFVGEKVPWLMIYPVLFGYVFNCVYWSKYKSSLLTYILLSLAMLLALKQTFNLFDAIKFDYGEKSATIISFYLLHFLLSALLATFFELFKDAKLSVTPVFGSLIIILLGITLNLRVLGSGNSREITLLSQVHTTKEFYNLIKTFDFLSTIQDLKVGYKGEATWPLAWLDKGREWLIFITEPNATFTCLIDDLETDLKKLGFTEKEVKFRGWAYFDVNHKKFSEFVDGIIFSDKVVEKAFSKVKIGCRNMGFFER